ncbi:MAG TPA: isocitrate lyase/phosphoenolpyruvate mutase family protein [Candidatus Binataceae bacterium]|nr:isocitrate lyase/phosphoenolpyruvate mutase family protein [Candidatus Binataceae bacterium]
MDLQAQIQKAEAFRRMHDRSRILVLVNAWDAASARIIEEAGARAIATTSAGVANALGYSDGQFLPHDEAIAAVARIARVIAVPLTADIEAGFAEEANELRASIRSFIEAGAVGINFEDSHHRSSEPLYEIDVMAARIRTVREAASATKVPLVINARTDVYLRQVGAPETRFDLAVKRANAYRAAGADSLFVPGVRDTETISRLVRAIDGPINILAGAGFPSIPELAKLGVARVSVGGAPALSALTHTRKVAQELFGAGTYSALEGNLSHGEANKLFAPR